MYILISENYIKEITPLAANVDVSEIKPHIKIAQDIYIKRLLGEYFYDQIQLRGESSPVSLTSDDIVLLKLIKPALAYYTLYKALPYLNFKLRNKGVMSQSGENTTSATLTEVQFLQQNLINDAEYHANRVKDFLCKNETLYPEYTSADNSVDNIVKPSKSPYSIDIYIDDLDGPTRNDDPIY